MASEQPTPSDMKPNNTVARLWRMASERETRSETKPTERKDGGISFQIWFIVFTCACLGFLAAMRMRVGNEAHARSLDEKAPQSQPLEAQAP